MTVKQLRKALVGLPANAEIRFKDDNIIHPVTNLRESRVSKGYYDLIGME